MYPYSSATASEGRNDPASHVLRISSMRRSRDTYIVPSRQFDYTAKIAPAVVTCASTTSLAEHSGAVEARTGATRKIYVFA